MRRGRCVLGISVRQGLAGGVRWGACEAGGGVRRGRCVLRVCVRRGSCVLGVSVRLEEA